MNFSQMTNNEPWTILARDYVPGEDRPEHCHAEGQLLYAAAGVMLVKSGSLRRFVAPRQALWIPARCPHAIAFLSPTAMRNLYFATYPKTLTTTLLVFEVTPLLRELMAALFLKTTEKTLANLMSRLVLQLVSEAETVDKEGTLVMPTDARLRKVADQVLGQGDWKLSADELAASVFLTPRTFARHFEAETGMTFREWRVRARLMTAFDLLARGMSVKATALKLGYSGAPAFSSAFQRQFGMVPSQLAAA